MKTFTPTWKKLLLQGILFLVFWSPSSAQESDRLAARHSIMLGVGLNQIKELNLHRKVSTGSFFELNYGFEKRSKGWHQFHFAVGYGRPRTALEDVSKSVNIKINSAYSRSFLVVDREKFKYYLGPEVSFSYSMCFFPNWDDSHLYWGDHYSLGFTNSLSIPLKNEKEFVAFVSLPLFSVMSRPDVYRLYKIDEVTLGGFVQNLNSNLTAASWTNAFYFRLLAEYRFPAFKTKREAFIFSCDYARLKQEEGNAFMQLLYQLGIKMFL